MVVPLHGSTEGVKGQSEQYRKWAIDGGDCRRTCCLLLFVISYFRLLHSLSLPLGVLIFGNFLYASSPTTVYRWPFPAKGNEVNTPTKIITNMNAKQRGDLGAPDGHATRSLAMDSKGLLYVSVGSAGNVDVDSYRSRIRRFSLTGWSVPKCVTRSSRPCHVVACTPVMFVHCRLWHYIDQYCRRLAH